MKYWIHSHTLRLVVELLLLTGKFVGFDFLRLIRFADNGTWALRQPATVHQEENDVVRIVHFSSVQLALSWKFAEFNSQLHLWIIAISHIHDLLRWCINTKPSNKLEMLAFEHPKLQQHINSVEMLSKSRQTLQVTFFVCLVNTLNYETSIWSSQIVLVLDVDLLDLCPKFTKYLL